MNVITIGSDEKLFELGSAVLKRQFEYAERMDSLHIVVMTTQRNLTEFHSKNLHIYPTVSISKIMYVWDAFRLAKKIIRDNGLLKSNTVLSAQDAGESGLAAHLATMGTQIKLHLQVHTDIFSPFFSHTPLNYIRIIIARYIIPRAAHIRTVSSLVRNSIAKHFPQVVSRISVLPIFVDIESIKNYQPKRDLKKDFPQFDCIVLSLSRLTKEKNLDHAIHAFSEVQKKHPQSGLLIVGDGTERVYLEKMVEKLHLSKSVLFLGWQDDVISLYKTCDVYLLTSLYEGYGMSLVEAAASGAAIATTSVGIVQDVCENNINALVCDVGDADCMIQNLGNLVAHPELRALFKVRIQDSIRTLYGSREDYSNSYVRELETLL